MPLMPSSIRVQSSLTLILAPKTGIEDGLKSEVKGSYHHPHPPRPPLCQRAAVSRVKPRPAHFQQLLLESMFPSQTNKCNLTSRSWSTCLILASHAQNTSPGRRPADILASCPNHFTWLLSLQKSSTVLSYPLLYTDMPTCQS